MNQLKQFTRAAAFQLQDDNLAITLQLWAESVARVLVFMYVSGVIAGEIVQPYLTQLGELFTYKIPQMRDVTDAVQQETVNVRGTF